MSNEKEYFAKLVLRSIYARLMDATYHATHMQNRCCFMMHWSVRRARKCIGNQMQSEDLSISCTVDEPPGRHTTNWFMARKRVMRLVMHIEHFTSTSFRIY